jgi:excisionase family DNA binding protein
MSPRYLTTQEVADHFRVSVSRVIRWIKAGSLPGSIDVGTAKKPNYRIPESSLSGVVRNAESSPMMPEGVEKII